jgi:hypothetical protein
MFVRTLLHFHRSQAYERFQRTARIVVCPLSSAFAFAFRLLFPYGLSDISRSIGKPLADDTLEGALGAPYIIYAEPDTVAIACQRRSKSRPLGRSKNRPVCGVGIEHDAPRPARRRWPGFRSRGGRGFQEAVVISPVSGSATGPASSAGWVAHRRLAFDCLSR